MFFPDVERAYLEAKRAEHITEGTLKSYQTTYRKFKPTVDGLEFKDITVQHIIRYLGSLTVSKKTALNHHTALSSLWAWAVSMEIVEINVVRQVRAPKPEKPTIIPLEQPEAMAMLAATEATANPLRNRAILMLFLDTGIRVGEMQDLTLHNLNLMGKTILVMGKGRKERIIPVSDETLSVLLAYLKARGLTPPFFSNAPLFLSKETGKALTISGIRKIVYKLSERAMIKHVHPHQLRHTFATWYLRAGGSAHTLQMILGHSTLEMVKRYVLISRDDIRREHDKASPIKYWGIKP